MLYLSDGAFCNGQEAEKGGGKAAGGRGRYTDPCGGVFLSPQEGYGDQGWPAAVWGFAVY